MRIVYNLLVLLCPALLLVACFPQAEARAVEGGLSVKPVGLSIALKDPDSKFNSSFSPGMQPGVQVALLVESAKRGIVSVAANPKQAIKISADGKSISEEDDDSWQFLHPRISDDGKRATFNVSAEDLPAADTAKLSVTGELLVSTGSKTAEDEIQAKLVKGTKFKLAGIAVEVTEAGKPSWGEEPLSVTLNTSDPGGFDKIKSVEFHDKAGEQIKSKSGGSMTMNMGAHKQVSIDYRLGKKVDAATIKVVYYADLQTDPLPLKLEVGLGL
ncbi:hypothetical protein [Adhaeretor mobilis]|uniref:Uncharacterized protein n=1 Tax=Adhaeretor mobilis TaxID=1930276 RepID=A0A517MRI3_9BACT|nr:hypothetical protein [Adhaeretor mobilis]QDS97490.1 hypothetical protein HG15A2_07510 [Adhaeretor mobilis]